MIAGKWVAPALLFFAGAVFGRIFGVKPLVRGAMTAATMSGMLPDTSSSTSARPSRSAPRKIARATRRRPAQKRSSAA